ncbi:MAG: 50S ribosomal protein L11 methyltransferase [Betaproteobacteria bacterium]|nr:50S ribosomal protein L11 methyltransferase [Betaproteobacteria bacterium]
MNWRSVTFALPQASADAFGDALLAAGAISVNVEDADEGTAAERPIFGEPGAAAGLWQQCRLNALFADDADVDAAIVAAAVAVDISRPSYQSSVLADVDWVAQNREQFQPISISPRVWIVPTWHAAPDPGAVNIVLDPGAAFGTGSHPTTRLCLQWLEETLAAAPATTVIDYGCGSGILAIAAMKLGARAALGVDIDPGAVATARFNAVQNAVTADFRDSEAEFDDVGDVVVANILANPLRVLAPLLAAHTRAGGRLALAGILDDQAAEIISIYRPWFDLAIWRSEDGWSCLAGVRTG